MSNQQPREEIINLEQNEEPRILVPSSQVSDLARFVRGLKDVGFTVEQIQEELTKDREEETKRQAKQVEEETKRQPKQVEEETKRLVELKKLELENANPSLVELKKLELENAKASSKQVGKAFIFIDIEIEAILHWFGLDSLLSGLFHRSDYRICSTGGQITEGSKGEMAYHRLSLCDNDFPNDNSPLRVCDQNIGTLRNRKK